MSEHVQNNLEKRIIALEETIWGGKGVDDDKGVVGLIRELIKDMYHEKNGCMVRLSELELERTKAKSAAWGAATIVKFFWTLAAMLLGVLLAKWFKV